MSLSALTGKLTQRQSAVGGEKGLSSPLTRLRRLIGRGLERTAALWPDIERAYAWVHAATACLGGRAPNSLGGFLGPAARPAGRGGKQEVVRPLRVSSVREVVVAPGAHAAAHGFDGPVVVKLLSRQVLHKAKWVA